MSFNEIIETIISEARDGSNEPFIVYRDKNSEWQCDFTQNQYGETFDWVEDVQMQDPSSVIFKGTDFSEELINHVKDEPILKKRIIDGYEEKQNVQIAGNLVIFAENAKSDEPYMVCYCKWDNPFGAEEYYNINTTTDYVKALGLYADGIKSFTQILENERTGYNRPTQVLTTAACIPNGLSEDLTDKVIIIKPEVLAPEYRRAEKQIKIATGGFGCSPDALGTAVFCTDLYSGKESRFERYDVLGVADINKLPEWTVEKLSEYTKSKEIPTVNEDIHITPKSKEEYDLGYGFLGNGIMVWNRAEERDGDYVTVAHIEQDHTITFYDKDMPDEVKASIEKSAWLIEADAVDLSLPDQTITIAEMQKYGYTADDMLPLSSGKVVELFDTGHPVFLLYPDNTEAMAFSRDEIITFDGLCGITHDDWEISPIYTAQTNVEGNNESSREADLLYGDGNRFGIYQVRDGDEFRNYRFTPMKELEVEGLNINRINYELVYTAQFAEYMQSFTDRNSILNYIYNTFNTTHPEDYMGHSVSVSDVIVLKYNGEISSYFVDSIGFVELPSFLGDETQKSQTVETSEQDKLSEKSERYFQVGNMSEKASKDTPTRKITLMERLEASKLKAAQQGQIANKNRELDRSDK